MAIGSSARDSAPKRGQRLSGVHAAFFAIALAVLLTLALVPVFPHQQQAREGDTASRTWQAPRDFSFNSEVLTEKQREQAAAAVPDVLVFSPDVRSQQVAKLEKLIGDVQNVRNSTDLTRSQKLSALGGTENLFAPDYEAFILDMSSDQWQSVTGQAQTVLEKVLEGSVARGQESTIADQVPQLIDPSLSDDEKGLVTALVKPLIAPNLEVDQAKTNQAKDAARAAVAPVLVTYTKNQTIVRSGEVIDSTAIEAMRQAGLLSSHLEWRSLVAIILLSLIAAGVLGYYVFAIGAENIADPRRLVLLLAVSALAVLAAKLYMPLVLPDHQRHFFAYALPLAVVPMLIAALVEGQLALIVAATLAALVTFVVAYLPDVSAAATSSPLDALRALGVYGFGGAAGALMVHRAERLNRYALAGVVVAAVSALVLIAVWFIDLDRTLWDLPWIALASSINGLLSAILAVGAFVTLGLVFGITTRVQLMELAQLNRPLLRRLQDEAPGTFHHSIIVGNLAERAADIIGADSLLVRVGCYYHDVGKLRQPGYFIENQMSGSNPHDKLPAQKSAHIISRHVEDGLELAREHRLPAQVRDLIAQHHGTGQAAYFYRKALKQGKEIDASSFSYPGPRPQTREAAIVMLADSAEAAVRAASDRSPLEIDARVDEVIAERLEEKQLDESPLTLRDISLISESFKATLRGVYHPRLEYPAAAPTDEGKRKRGRKRISPLSALSAFSVGEEGGLAEEDEEIAP